MSPRSSELDAGDRDGEVGAALMAKEQLRLVFQHRGPEAEAMLDAWLVWARRCQIPAFVELSTASNATARGSSQRCRIRATPTDLVQQV